MVPYDPKVRIDSPQKIGSPASRPWPGTKLLLLYANFAYRVKFAK